MISCDSHAQSEPAWKEDMKTFGNTDGYILLVRKLFFFSLEVKHLVTPLPVLWPHQKLCLRLSWIP